ncbi:MFS transporter [Leptospira sp. GIMC2001]|uniref:MFS transporter n=1 Tax=Leptospira sp. GIMC2001 TaxID=1513297 RepID=UPI00234A46BB|nr:MFS transporter [Leptospira sp. GIMC2001]WCL49048.1 MFS transporter [Leptospira sp. GIMC2001]
MYSINTFKILFQALIFSINLSVLTPLIKEVSLAYNIELNSGLLIFGGLNNLLLFGSMAVSSFLFSFYSGKVSVRICNLLLILLNFLIFLNINIYIFFISNFFIGSIIGVIIPTIFRFLKENTDESIAVQSVVFLNIMLGFGILIGQFISAVLIDMLFPWNSAFLVILVLFFGNYFISHSIDKVYRIDLKNSLKRNLENFSINRDTFLLLIQYLPGSIPWGAITVFIYPFSYEVRKSSSSLVVLYMTIFSIGMLVGSLIAGYIADRFKNAKRKSMLWGIILFLLLSVFYFEYFIAFYFIFSELTLIILLFLLGLILSVPGTYIKGLLFLNSSKEDVQKIFSIENFLESIGKGFGPLVVGGLIYSNSDIAFSFKIIPLFWLLCIIPVSIIFISGNSFEKR